MKGQWEEHFKIYNASDYLSYESTWSKGTKVYQLISVFFLVKHQ